MVVLIVELSGGLGNQLFQYASGCGIAERIGTTAKFYLSYNYTEQFSGTPRVYELPLVFTVNPPLASANEVSRTKAIPNNYLEKQFYKIWRRTAPYKYRHYVNERGRFFDKNMFRLAKNCYLEGYWQSEKYFEHIEPRLRHELIFRTKLNNDLSNKILLSNSVSVHFRRTDFRNNICDLDYYKKAVDFITQKADKPVLFVFSDDPLWVKQNFRTDLDCVYVEGNSAADDLQLMSFCRHNIVANSTFSWWGAWLNNNPQKIVIVPEQIKKNNNKDIVSERWLII